MLILPTVDLRRSDALHAAERWADEGATAIHVVAAPGAALRPLLDAMAARGVVVQLDGIESADEIERALAAGAARVVLPAASPVLVTLAARVGAERLVAALDAGEEPPMELAAGRLLVRAGAEPALSAIGELWQRRRLPMLIEADIREMAELRRVRWLVPYGVEGVVLGAGLDEGAISFQEGFAL